MKISTKLTIQILLISVIPLLILGGVALYQMGQLAEKEFFEKVSRDADFHQQQIEDYLSGQQRKVETLAASSQISALLSRILSSIDEELLPSPTGQSEIDQATKAYLDHYFWREAPSVVQDDSFSDLYLISNEGEVLYSYEHTEVMGQLVPQGEALTILRGIWSKVTEEETLVVEGYRRSPQSGEMAMYIASPVYSWKEMIGVVIVEYDAEWVEEMLVQSALLGDTEDLVVLVDGGDKAEFIRESRFLGLSHPCKAYSNSLLDPVLVSVEGDESRGVGWRINSRCQEVVADWRFLKAINAMMVVTVEKTEVMESYLWFQKLFTSLIAGVMLIILIISFSASHRITRRVVVLTQHALEIATGDLQQRIGDFGNDEVGVLADALRSMMKTIRDRTRTLEHANQRMLEEEIHREELIETRTQELFEANSYMEKILASMHDVLVVSDQHGKIRMMNPAAMELLGYSEEELLGRPLLEVIDANIGESSEQFNLQQLDNLRKNLEEVMVSDHACAQRQLENSLIALLWIDERCMVEVANIEAERVFGYSREVLFGCKIERLIPDLDLASIEESTVIEVQGRTQEGGDVEIHLGVTPIHTPEGLRQLLVIYDQAIAERWALSTFTPFGRLFFQGGQYPEVQLKERDGALIPALLSGEVLRDSQQRYQGFVLVMWDLRERKALEAKSNEAAYQGGLGEMSATILHNIGNVVTGLGGSVHSVRQQLDDLQLVSKGLGRLGEQLQESDVNVERLQQMSRAV
ncbi:MAG: PAS domain S-box protein, partial [Thiotrichales bacterium]|nr:PAS domain S-box protein [Thiotrichales bacterium]